MRILIVSHEFPPLGGGGANACYYLAKGYIAAGNDVTIVTANYKGLLERETVNGATVIRVNAKRKHKEHCNFVEMASYLLHAFPVVNKLVKKEKFDICQVFFGIPSGPLGYWIKKRYKVPYIIRFGGGDIPGFQARFTKAYKLIGPFLKMFWKNADALVANSEGLRQMALGFYDKKEIGIIPNGVDTDYFVPLKREEKDISEINILFVSRLIERKGLQFVIPGLHELIENSDKKVKLTVVGEGPYRRQLESLAKENHVDNYISFEGYKNKLEILEYYQNADLFILPSKKEGMPNVVLEAISCGLPVVMTPCEGAKELVSDNGIIVERESFVRELGKLLQDEPLMRKMAVASREKAVKEFSWDGIVNRYLDLFRSYI